MNTTIVAFSRRVRAYWMALALVIATAGMAVGVNGCVTDPVTGNNVLSFMSRDQEIQLGQQGDAQILAEFGAYNDAQLAAFVDAMGKKLAAVSDDPNYPYTFRVLDSPVINAFALPGGPVYVTRGLLAHLENDAQLAVVLGHEIGHITAHHGARQYTKQEIYSVGLGLGAALFEDIRPFLGAAQTGIQLLLLQNSRGDETDADELGVRYATKAGFEASEGAKFFETLKRMQDLQSDGVLPTWLSTHPDPGNREVTVRERAAYWKQQNNIALTGVNPEVYLPRLQNLVYGENPRNGFVSGSTFYYPGPEGQSASSFQFQVPSGWAVGNFASQVQLMPNSENPDAAIILSPGGNTSPTAAANQFVTDNGATVIQSSSVTVNGNQAVRLISDITITDANGQATGILRVMSYFISKNGELYVFHGYTAQAGFSGYQSTFESVFQSFQTVTNASVLAIQPFRVRVFQAPSTAPFSSLVHPNTSAGADITARAIMNQRQVSETVTAGAYLKEVVGP
jgi:predicted Zn-dependent protease